MILARLRCWFFHAADTVRDGDPARTHRGLILPLRCLRCGLRWDMAYFGGQT